MINRVIDLRLVNALGIGLICTLVASLTFSYFSFPYSNAMYLVGLIGLMTTMAYYILK